MRKIKGFSLPKKGLDVTIIDLRTTRCQAQAGVGKKLTLEKENPRGQRNFGINVPVYKPPRQKTNQPGSGEKRYLPPEKKKENDLGKKLNGETRRGGPAPARGEKKRQRPSVGKGERFWEKTGRDRGD